MARVTAFGLDMPEEVQAMIIAAVRFHYPELTAGLPDERAMQVVLKRVITDWVASYVEQKATPPIEKALAEVEETLRGKRRAARTSALAAAEQIIPTAPGRASSPANPAVPSEP